MSCCVASCPPEMDGMQELCGPFTDCENDPRSMLQQAMRMRSHSTLGYTLPGLPLVLDVGKAGCHWMAEVRNIHPLLEGPPSLVSCSARVPDACGAARSGASRCSCSPKLLVSQIAICIRRTVFQSHQSLLQGPSRHYQRTPEHVRVKTREQSGMASSYIA